MKMKTTTTTTTREPCLDCSVVDCVSVFVSTSMSEPLTRPLKLHLCVRLVSRKKIQ
jgi:hypothetical protein